MPKTKKKRQHVALPADLTMATPLPPELLWDIFHLVQSDRQLPSSSLQHNTPPLFDSVFSPELQWVPEITHICRHWRAVALADPSLWTNIHVSASNRWATEFLSRSKESPAIKVSWNIGVGAVVSGSNDVRKKANHKLCRMLFRKIPDRLESLSFIDVGVEQVDGIIRVNHPDEILRDLKEFTLSGHPEDRWITYCIEHPEPNTQYIFNPTNLHRLDLTNCTINHSFLQHFRCLRHLRLDHRQDNETEAPAGLLEALKGMTRLQELILLIEGEIDGNYDTEDDLVMLGEPHPISGATEFPDLQFIQLVHPSPKWIRHILHTIAPILPGQMPVLHMRNWDVDTSDLSVSLPANRKLLPTLFEHIPNVDINTVQMAFINDAPDDYHVRQGVTFSFWTRSTSPIRDSRDTLLPPTMKYRIELKSYQWVDRNDDLSNLKLLELLCHAGAYNNLGELQLVHPPALSEPEGIANTIGQLPGLQTIRFKLQGKCPYMKNFFWALTIDTDESSTHLIPFKALKSIYVKGAKSITAALEREILYAIQARHSLDFPITTLGLPMEDPKAGYLRDLEKLQLVVNFVVISD